MKFFSEDFDLFNDANRLQMEVEESLELVFDDEPLERILYGKKLKGPTRANLFFPALGWVQKIRRAFKDGDIRAAVKNASELAVKEYSISTQMCFELSLIMRGIVPDYPNPIIEIDLSPLGPLLEQMWNLALRSEGRELQKTVGAPLYRWYEHHQQYENARRVLTTLIEIAKEDEDRIGEAVVINNFAFEYLLEGRPEGAISFFEKAAKIFEDNEIIFEYANARANYWTCRFECDDLEEDQKIEAELKSLAKTLGKKADWRTRKPLILLARIEERRGNISAAVQLVERAIKACKNGKTRYPELDRKYLEHLKCKVTRL